MSFSRKYSLERENNYSSIIWALSCYIFAGIIAVTTRMMTHDPNFSGGPETPWLLPMLLSVVIGLLSFCSMVLSWIFLLFKKENIEYNAPLGITTAKSFFSVILLGVVGIIFIIGYRNANMGYKKSDYNGQQLFEAVNEFRIKNGKSNIKLDQYICDNLVDRYLKIKSGDVGHEGFEEWVINEGIDKRFDPIAELYTKEAYRTKDAIDFWDGSPGHRLSLLGDFSVGCAYANEGTGVVILGKPLQG